MKRRIVQRLMVFSLIVSMVIGPFSLSSPIVQAQAEPVQSGGTVHLPLIAAPPGPPDFTIISPTPDLSVSGTSFFAVQPLDPASVTSVAFQAGDASLGTDSTSNDGFQVFLDAATLPAGPLQLSATASGPSGTTTKRVTVTIVRSPPASATVGAIGSTLATTSTGSMIIVPPGAVKPGTKITVQDKTREQTTQEDGLDWDAIGVTFLGAIDVQANGPISKPLGVSSVGFGNRVQQGQAVVTYRVLPDADGDGVGELVVVNGANLAPNGTFVSSPVAQIAVNSMVCSQGGVNAAGVAPASLAQQDLHGSPGAMITIQGGGFNPNSIQGNVATFHSLVNGKSLDEPAIIEQNSVDANDQTESVLVPVFPPGAATLLLRNQSTGSTSGPYNLTVDAAPPLSGPAGDIIDSYFAQSLDFIATLPANNAEQATEKTAMTDNSTQLRAAFAGLSKDSTPEIQQYLHDTATIIEGSGVINSVAALNVANPSGIHVPCVTPEQRNLANFFLNMDQVFGTIGCALLAVGPKSPTLATVCGVGYAAVVNWARFLLGTKPDCPSQSPPPAACTPTTLPNIADGAGKTGMGSAPPPGGNACGNAGGGPNLSVQSAHAGETTSGRFIVKIFKQSGGGLLTPFTGATDPGGYFFIPLIPQGEPFRALATDQETGASVSVQGVGPAMGQSTFINFDFSNAQQNHFDIAVGDTVSNGVPGPGAGNIEEAGGLDIYNFTATAGQRVFFDLLGKVINIGWQLHSPSGATIFDTCTGCFEPGALTLPEAGTYKITVGGETSNITGTYSFKLWDVPAPQHFAIAVGDTISNGVPASGAGNIETPGVEDIYTFHANANQRVFFDLLGKVINIGWQLHSPSGATIFDTCTGCFEPGAFTLPEAGTYTITVGQANSDDTGTYSFKLWDVPAPQHFAIAIGDTISNGVPASGAGNIETPGVEDIYTFHADAGQKVFFDILQTTITVRSNLHAPDGSELFQKCLACGDPAPVTLAQTGTYTITVGQANNDDAGTYSFKLTPQ